MPCMFQCILPKFMEARSLLQNQNASDLAFLPIEIHLGNAEGENWKKRSGNGNNVCFPHLEIFLWKAECGSEKRVGNSKVKCMFPHPEFRSGRQKVVKSFCRDVEFS